MRCFWISLGSLVLTCCVSFPQQEKTFVVEQKPNYTIHQYISSQEGFLTNSFWIEGPQGIMIVDTQFIPSATKEIYDAILKKSNKPIVVAVILHANPDKFNGTQFLTEKGVRVVTSKQIRDIIPQVDTLRRKWFYDRFKPDYPDKLVLPEAICDVTQDIEFIGLNFRFHVLGASVSKAHLVLQLDDNIFMGDMIANGFHSWLELAKVDKWLESLDYVEMLFPQKIYPGRGKVAGKKLLRNEKEYLKFVQKTVVQHFNNKDLTDEKQQEIVHKIKKEYPKYGAPFFLDVGVPEIWKKLQNK